MNFFALNISLILYRKHFSFFTGLPGFRGMEGMPNMGGFGVNRMGGS